METIFSSQVDLIREVFNYQNRFKDSIMVFKIDFPVINDPGFPGIAKDIALLAKTGFKVIIVPGAKENIDAALNRHGINSSYIKIEDYPVRITTQQAIPFVEMSAFHAASKFMTFLSGSHDHLLPCGHAGRVEGVIGNFVRARGLGVIDGVDLEHTGTVDKIYIDSLKRVLDLGMVPVLPCIGWSPSGKPYNVLSDEIALAVSAALNAEKLFILSKQCEAESNMLNLPDDVDGSLARLTPKQAEAVLTANKNLLDSRFLRELKIALNACRTGVRRVHIIDGKEEGSVLKEMFSNLGAGTMVYTDEYDSIRALRSRDLPDILRLMEPLMQKGVLVRRTAEQIQENKADYVVFEIDGSIRACGALHNWNETQGEIAAVATDPQYTTFGLGKRIVSYLIEKGRINKMNRIFALTTQTQDWFEALGFKETTVDTLPERKRALYDEARKSKVFSLDLR